MAAQLCHEALLAVADIPIPSFLSFVVVFHCCHCGEACHCGNGFRPESGSNCAVIWDRSYFVSGSGNRMTFLFCDEPSASDPNASLAFEVKDFCNSARRSLISFLLPFLAIVFRTE